MSRRRVTAARIIGFLVVIAVGYTVYSTYDFHSLRPERHQRLILGHVEARRDRLEKFEPDVSPFGDALFVWNYSLNAAQAANLSRRCARWDRGACILGSRSARSGEDVIIELRDRTLRIEEWWY